MKGALAILFCAALALPAAAEGWQGFYAPTRKAPTPAPEQTTEAPAPLLDTAAPGRSDMAWDGVCIREILAAQQRHGIPDNLLLAIGLQEAGTRRNGRFTVWPFAVNAAGEGRLFDSREAAMHWVAERRGAGVASIDVGCMQINLRWHPDAFVSVAEGFDPRVNVDYAARFLKRLYQQTGDWMTAAGSYHSFEPKYRDVYLARLERNLRAANAGLPQYTQIAAGAPVMAAASAPRPAPRETATRAAPGPASRLGVGWTSGLSGERSVRMSLYSAQALQPVLPDFRGAEG